MAKNNSVDWEEAERFDRWIRANAGPLLEYVFNEKEEKPFLRDIKGIILATRLYYKTNGARV